LKKTIFSALYFTISCYCCCIGQIIKNIPLPIETGAINFNPEIIKANKIKGIEIKVVNKPDGAFIVDKGTTYVYKFNAEGYITHYYYTIFSKLAVAANAPTVAAKPVKNNSPKEIYKYINDTIFTDIIYDSLNRISCKRIKTDNIYDASYYSYNNENKIIKEVRYKETNLGSNLNDFKLGTQELVFSGTFDYKLLSPNQIKKIALNNSKLPYKNTFIKYDVKKNIINETTESTVSSLRQEQTYAYNTAGKLIKKTYKTNETGSAVLESVYEYGKGGNLTSEKKYKNNELIYETNYIYDENGLFLKSEANRSHTSSTVFIAKYIYEFYQ